MRFEDDGGFAFRFAWMTTRPTLCLHAGVGRGQASKPHQQCTGWRGGAGLSAPQRTARDAVRPDLAILDVNLPRKDGRGAGGSQGRQNSAHCTTRGVQYLALDPGHSAQLRARRQLLRSQARESGRLFFCRVAHELPTPLTCIHQYVPILRDGLAGAMKPEQTDHLKTILKVWISALPSVFDCPTGNSGLDTRTEKTRRNVVPLSMLDCGQGGQRLNRRDCKIAHSGSSGTP
jgi:hypothetical protein